MEKLGPEALRAKWRTYYSKSKDKRRHRNNERERERYARDRAIAARLDQARQLQEEGTYANAGISVVRTNAIQFDLTRWTGPGCLREKQLEAIADDFLRSHGTDPARSASCTEPNNEGRLPETHGSEKDHFHQDTEDTDPHQRLVNLYIDEYLRRLRR